MSGRKASKDDFDVIMKKVRADIAAGRLLNLALYKFVVWLREKHQLDTLESLLVAIEILKSLPNVLMEHEINTYILKARTAYTEPEPKPDEQQ